MHHDLRLCSRLSPQSWEDEGRLGFLIWVGFFTCVTYLGSCGFVVKNSLRVTYPESLKDAYECATGNFGIPQNEHGGTVVGTVVYPQANQKSCSRSHHFDVSFKSQPADLPIFLLADRGNCYFALKVWSAQNAGAAAVLIADNIAETFPVSRHCCLVMCRISLYLQH
ncbi:unnamed protein product, partial [Vitis vinifera]|uniref:PA domain-containing protein n=1 Tax=Vitis vinifera TaxID=29760 RepID=D7TQW4_VITVI